MRKKQRNVDYAESESRGLAGSMGNSLKTEQYEEEQQKKQADQDGIDSNDAACSGCQRQQKADTGAEARFHLERRQGHAEIFKQTDARDCHDKKGKNDRRRLEDEYNEQRQGNECGGEPFDGQLLL